MNIALYISNLLKNNQELALPNFGVIYKKRDWGYINTTTQTIVPPRTLLQFRAYPNTDKTLIHYVCTTKNLSPTSGEYFVNQYIEELTTELEKNGLFEIPSIGTFKLHDGQIAFDAPYNDIYDQDFFGLPLFPITIVQFEEDTLPVEDNQSPTGYIQEIEPFSENKTELENRLVDDNIAAGLEQFSSDIVLEQEEKYVEENTVNAINQPQTVESDIITSMPSKSFSSLGAALKSSPNKKNKKIVTFLLVLVMLFGVGGTVYFLRYNWYEQITRYLSHKFGNTLLKDAMQKYINEVPSPSIVNTIDVSTQPSIIVSSTTNTNNQISSTSVVNSITNLTNSIANKTVKLSSNDRIFNKNNTAASDSDEDFIDLSDEATIEPQQLVSSKKDNKPQLSVLIKENTDKKYGSIKQEVLSVNGIRYDIISQSFNKRSDAEKHIRTLAYRTSQTRVVLDTAKNIYRVCLGSFKDRAAAERELKKMPPEFVEKLWIMQIKPSKY